MLQFLRNNVRILSLGLLIAATPFVAQAQTTGGTGGVSTSCADIGNYGPFDQVNGAGSCTCTVYLLWWQTSSNSVPCQRSIDTTPAHSHCEGSSEINDCHPFGVVQVTRQKYKCECELSGPDVEVGGVTIGIGGAQPECKTDGGPTNNGTHPTAVATECQTVSATSAGGF